MGPERATLFISAWLLLTIGGLIRYNVHKNAVKPVGEVDILADRHNCTVAYILISVGILLGVLMFIA